MGKYNFSAQRFMEIEKRLAELEKANEELRAENASLRKPKKPSHKDRGVMNNIKNTAQARVLFDVEAKNGKVIISKNKFKENLSVFYQNIGRVLDPSVRKRNNNAKSAEALSYTPLTEITDEEFDIYMSVIDQCIEAIAYGKTQLSNLRNGKAVG